MHPPGPRRIALTLLFLIVVPTGLIFWKTVWRGYAFRDVLPIAQYFVTVGMSYDGHNADLRVQTFLPRSDHRQQISDEKNNAPGLRFVDQPEGPNRAAIWASSSAPDGGRIELSYAAEVRAIRFDIDATLPVPAEHPPTLAPALAAEENIQSTHPDIRAALVRIGADRGPMRERLQRIFALTTGLAPRPFKGTTDALTALRLGEASCNGRSRLFVALARAAGIPARLVGGLILETGSKRTSHQWVEVLVGEHWIPFCPTNRHFAELPGTYLGLYRGDEALFRHTADVNFDYRFEMRRELVPSPGARQSAGALDVWALHDRLAIPLSLLRTVLMLPLGALVVVLFRNVFGVPTFGTFLPALLASAAGETGPGWGLLVVLLVAMVVVSLRFALDGLALLHSPTLAILLTAVSATLLGGSVLADRFGLTAFAHMTLFPVAVLAIGAERLYLALAEQGVAAAARQLGGSLVVMLGCYVVMHSLALTTLVMAFPEILMIGVAANVHLGRWAGLRVSEYLRFRPVLLGGGRHGA